MRTARVALTVAAMLVLGALACSLESVRDMRVRDVEGTLAAEAAEVRELATQIAPTLAAAGERAEGIATQAAPAVGTAGQRAGLFLTQAAGTISAMTQGVSEGAVEQWAASASALSEYSDTDRSAAQAAGLPDTHGCADAPTAWASREHDEVTALILTYDRAVVPEYIHIYQTFNPGAITSVEVVDESGQSYTVYQAAPQPTTDCPHVRTIGVDGIAAPVNQVVINVDQRNHPGRNEIDAVQLVGVP